MATQTTQVIPPVQLPPGVVPTPQAGTSKDVLALAKKQAVNPLLPTGTAITPIPQQIQTGETLATPGVSTTVPTAVAPTATATQAAAVTPTADVITGVVIPAGVTIYGQITAFTISAGAVLAYHAA